MFVRKSKYEAMEKMYQKKITENYDKINTLINENNERVDKISELQDKVLDLQAELRMCKGEGWHKPFTFNDALEILDNRKSYFEDRVKFARGLPDTEYVKELMYQHWECDKIMGLLFEQLEKSDNNEDGD